MNYLKIGQAKDLAGNDYKIYRIFEIFPGILSWFTLLFLIVLSYFNPVLVAYIIIAFDVYWLLLVVYLGLHLIAAYRKYKKNAKVDWLSKLKNLTDVSGNDVSAMSLAKNGFLWTDITHLIVLPFSFEGIDVIRPTMEAIVKDGFPTKQMIVVLAAEERAGEKALERAKDIEKEFTGYFKNFLITIHPDGIVGEIKGKGANQAWAAKKVKAEVIDKNGFDYEKILVSVFDIDTVVLPGYFSCLTYKFLTVANPYRASYQPIPLYNNNIWRASFFARVAANSNTFWQMMQQIRSEKLATYSSHSMTWRALTDVGFWSTNMVSEDSRIFWHCYCYYDCDYRVEPLNFPVSMDIAEGKNAWNTIKSLYIQQRRWGWGVENLPYLIFNAMKRWKTINKRDMLSKIFTQLYGFHSWATNALIIGVVGWMPMLIGGDRFNSSVLSTNLPMVTRSLMMAAMSGMVLSAIISTLLLPQEHEKLRIAKKISMLLQWIILPVSIIIFGAIPGLEAQTRMIIGRRLGFQVTPKGTDAASLDDEKINWHQK
jgi:hypothetical protein